MEKKAHSRIHRSEAIVQGNNTIGRFYFSNVLFSKCHKSFDRVIVSDNDRVILLWLNDPCNCSITLSPAFVNMNILNNRRINLTLSCSSGRSFHLLKDNIM